MLLAFQHKKQLGESQSKCRGLETTVSELNSTIEALQSKTDKLTTDLSNKVRNFKSKFS